MARVRDALPENAPGELFVDASCIDCDTCRWVAPATFGRAAARGQSVVVAQPGAAPERLRAYVALVSCPTASIGTRAPGGGLARIASHSLPEPVRDDVYYCGYAAESSYGASSWLIRRPDGNVLVDSPRAARPLLDRIEALGGVRWLFLTHRDDVADHERWSARFGCERVLHEADVTPATRAVERVIRGTAPTRLADDLLVIPVPGHTAGSAALLYDDVLFTGDHLWGDEHGGLDASEAVCWWSWDEQVRSLARLRAHDFAWVLPGHERPLRCATPAEMRGHLDRLLTIVT